MAYTEPTERQGGDTPSASDFNRDIIENIKALHADRFNNRVFPSTIPANGVLVGDGSGELTTLTLSDGELIIGTSTGVKTLAKGNEGDVLKGNLKWVSSTSDLSLDSSQVGNYVFNWLYV